MDTPAISALLWFACAVAAVGAAAAVAAWRNESGRRRDALREVLRCRSELDAMREDAGRRKQRRAENHHEVGDLRRKLEKAKRRAFQAQERVAPLETELAAVRRELAARDTALGRAAQEGTLAEARLERANEALEAARAELEAARAPVAPVPPPGDELSELRRTLAQRDAAVDDLAKQVAAAEREAGRYRQRARTQQRLYNVLRLELEVAKDRIRELQNTGPSGGTAIADTPMGRRRALMQEAIGVSQEPQTADESTPPQ